MAIDSIDKLAAQIMNRHSTSSTWTDVIIVGNGLVGQSLAIGLAKAGMDVMVIAKTSPEDIAMAQSQRYSSFNPSSMALLQKLNIVEPNISYGCPMRIIEVYDAYHDQPLTFHASQIDDPYLGCIINHGLLLKTSAKTLPSITTSIIGQPVELRQQPPDADYPITITLQDGHTYHSKWLIGADGQHSWVRQYANFGYAYEKSHHQKGIVIHVSCHDHHHTGIQRFLPSGPLAFLPSSHQKNQYSGSLVWSIDNDLYQQFQDRSSQQWADAATQALNHRYHHSWEALGPWHAFDLSSHHVKQYHQGSIALIGDAAHHMHPLAGQGLNRGLADVACLLDIIDQLKAHRLPRCHPSALIAYQHRCAWRNDSMIQMIHAIKYTYQYSRWPVPILRKLGQGILEHCLPLKSTMMQLAR